MNQNEFYAKQIYKIESFIALQCSQQGTPKRAQRKLYFNGILEKREFLQHRFLRNAVLFANFRVAFLSCPTKCYFTIFWPIHFETLLECICFYFRCSTSYRKTCLGSENTTPTPKSQRSCSQDYQQGGTTSFHQNVLNALLCFEFVKADLHGTTLSHTTSLRQVYDMTQDLHDNRKGVVGLIYKKQFMSRSQACRKLVVCA